MKSLTVTTFVALAALFAAKPALAVEAIDVSELSCKQFTGYNDDNKGLIMMCFEGYYTTSRRTSISARWQGTWRKS
jgi:HdeA/HdeB family